MHEHHARAVRQGAAVVGDAGEAAGVSLEPVVELVAAGECLLVNTGDSAFLSEALPEGERPLVEGAALPPRDGDGRLRARLVTDLHGSKPRRLAALV